MTPINWPLLVGKVMLVVTGLALVGFVIWKVFFAGGEAAQKSQAVQAKDQQVVQQRAVQAQAAAVPIIVKNFNNSAGIDAQTQEAIREALAAQGAKQLVDPALDAIGRRAICVRSSAAGLSGCDKVLNPGP